MFSTDFMMSCVLNIKQNIILPDKGFFVLNENNLRLCYYVDGKPFYIIIPSRAAVATYLVDNGIIDSFGTTCTNEVVLYRHSFSWDIDNSGKPIMIMEKKILPWHRVKITRSEVQTLAAMREFERCSAGIPIEKASMMYTPAKYNF